MRAPVRRLRPRSILDRDVTICLVYFKSLTLANLDAALHSVRQQDLSCVKELIVLDNNTLDDEVAILDVVESFGFPVPKRVLSFKHGDRTKTHSWSTNIAIRESTTAQVLFTRADYLLRFDTLARMLAVAQDAFVVGNGCHLANGVKDCDATRWRDIGPQIFTGAEFDYTEVDAGVYLIHRDAFDRVGGLNEELAAWGHAQTDFQHRLHQAGTAFVRIPEILFWHPAHGGEKDIHLAHQQLAGAGGDLKTMWQRYHGRSPYASV